MRSPVAGRTRRSRPARGSAAASRAARSPSRRCFGSLLTRCRRAPTMRFSISTNVPDSGRSDQRVSAVTWNRHDQALAAALRRSRVACRRPGSPRCGRSARLPARPAPGGSRLRRSAPSFRRTGFRARTPPDCCGFSQRQTAAENAAAAPQLHRHQIVVGGRPAAGRQSAPARRHSRSNVVEPFARVSGDIADIGEDQHRQALVDESVDRLAPASRGRRAARRRTGRARAPDSRSRPAAVARCRWSSR